MRTNIRWQGYARKQYFKRASSEKNVCCAVSISAASFGDILEAVDSTPALPLGCLVIAISRPVHFSPDWGSSDISWINLRKDKNTWQAARATSQANSSQCHTSESSRHAKIPESFVSRIHVWSSLSSVPDGNPLLSRHVLDQMLLPSSRALSCRVSCPGFFCDFVNLKTHWFLLLLAVPANPSARFQLPPINCWGAEVLGVQFLLGDYIAPVPSYLQRLSWQKMMVRNLRECCVERKLHICGVTLERVVWSVFSKWSIFVTPPPSNC